MRKATAIAHPNIALVKYWGKRDVALNLPAVSSLSLTLDGFRTRTTVEWGADHDRVVVGDTRASPQFEARAFAFLDTLIPDRPPLHVLTESNFPVGAGLASSASGFAALTMAAQAAAQRSLDPTVLSRLSRQGSGSACRSFWGGFVEWACGEHEDGSDSHGAPIAPQTHWDVRMVVAIVEEGPKGTGSTEGMERSRATSPLYEVWTQQAQADVDEGREAVRLRDLDRLGAVMESSTLKMHATMHTASPPLMYWKPATLEILHTVFSLRERGVSAWMTMDAGPQVKVLCTAADAEQVCKAIQPFSRACHILAPGPAAYLDHGP